VATLPASHQPLTEVEEEEEEDRSPKCREASSFILFLLGDGDGESAFPLTTGTAQHTVMQTPALSGNFTGKQLALLVVLVVETS